MTKQSKASTTTKDVKDVKEVKQAAPVAPAPAVVEEKVSRKKKSESVAVPVTPAAVPESPPVAPSEPVADDAPVKRRQVTREDVEKDFDALLVSLDEEIEALRKNDDKTKAKGVRFLRSVSKRVRQLRSDSLRVASKKVRRSTSSSASGTSGFMKAVKISKDMQKFTGLKEDQLVSRVDVTRAICDYVKNNNLQNATDRRHIIPDEKLAKLLGTGDQMRYCDIQKHIQPHFIKA